MKMILRNLYFKILMIAFFAYTLFGFLLLPYLIQHYLPAIVYKNLGTHATLYKSSFNPYTFELNLEHFVLRDKASKRLASFNTLKIDFDVDDLLDGKLLFQRIYMKHLKVDIRIDESGNYNFQHIIDHLSQNSSEEERTDTNTTMIGIRIPKLHIDDARLLLKIVLCVSFLVLRPSLLTLNYETLVLLSMRRVSCTL